MSESRMRILVVEDEPHMAGLLRQGLSEEGHAVTVAADGREGLSLAASDSFDVLVLDVMLPGVDGWTVLRRLRTGGNQTPILMLTARDATGDIVQGLNSGADDYLTKPFSFDVLFARIRALGRRGPIPRSMTLCVADLQLHQGTRQVQRRERPIALTRTEYAILEFLMRSSPRVLTRQALMEAVWGGNADVENNTLDAFMRLLRSKIEGAGETKLLHTVRGVGYTLREDCA
jgi:DNA-binding response OmpR family regulator